MPYVALRPVDRATRRALADARWSDMAGAKPDLHSAISLQRKLIGLVDDLAASFDAGRPPRLSLPPRYLTTKLRSGIPALAGEPVQVPVETLQPTFVELCRALADGGGGEATLALRDAVEAGHLDTRAVLTRALRREQGALRVAATRAGLGHDLLWLVADLTVSPFAHALLASVFGSPVEPLAGTLNAWSRGYCPLCGSWPALAERLGTVRRLRCSLCASAWEVSDESCMYCSERGDAFAVLAPDPSKPDRAIDLCRTCKGYAKSVGTDASLPFPLVAIADLDSMDLDLIAVRAGFARPALRNFAARH
jgi:FdhE protein